MLVCAAGTSSDAMSTSCSQSFPDPSGTLHAPTLHLRDHPHCLPIFYLFSAFEMSRTNEDPIEKHYDLRGLAFSNLNRNQHGVDY
jgi:hypothetical protein